MQKYASAVLSAFSVASTVNAKMITYDLERVPIERIELHHID